NYSKLVDKKIEDKNNLSTEGFSPLNSVENGNSKNYKTKQDLLYKFSKEKDKIKGYTRNYDGKIKFSRKIDTIITRYIETDFMKKYSYGGIKNKNIVIDVFYK
ncbi:MAG: hypothetical protein Q9M94_05445, partial [Candidatus Gracilibacteria bacterium]|nr:hypothetical protein [Candidatus Gracilibacteria bacterium]